MARHKMVKGVCRLCGENTMLSYEHVPPRVAFNRQTKFVSVEFEEYIQAKNALKDPPKGKPRQGGIGYNSFCQKCNSFLGSHYVHAYKDWASGGIQLLNKENEFALSAYTIYNIQPLKILKQIISMFIAINGDWFLKSFPDLISFVSSPENTSLPDRYRVFMYLTRAERFRYMHFVSHGNIQTGTTVNCSEIAFPPYGYVMTFDFKGTIPYLNEITDFKSAHLESKGPINMVTYQLPTYMPFPLDYRSEIKIQSDIDKSNESLENLRKKYEARYKN